MMIVQAVARISRKVYYYYLILDFFNPSYVASEVTVICLLQTGVYYYNDDLIYVLLKYHCVIGEQGSRGRLKLAMIRPLSKL